MSQHATMRQRCAKHTPVNSQLKANASCSNEIAAQRIKCVEHELDGRQSSCVAAVRRSQLNITFNVDDGTRLLLLFHFAGCCFFIIISFDFLSCRRSLNMKAVGGLRWFVRFVCVAWLLLQCMTVHLYNRIFPVFLSSTLVHVLLFLSFVRYN